MEDTDEELREQVPENVQDPDRSGAEQGTRDFGWQKSKIVKERVKSVRQRLQGAGQSTRILFY